MGGGQQTITYLRHTANPHEQRRVLPHVIIRHSMRRSQGEVE